ncbi:MAG: hypothetical protein AAGJ10_15995 [Bacteroidota bacterium]
MKTKTLDVNGEMVKFAIVADLTLPATYGGDIGLLWYASFDGHHAILFDRSYLDLALEEFFQEGHQGDIADYDLPQFMREWRGARGWADGANHSGYDLDHDDFLAALALLRRCTMGQWITTEQLDAMQAFARAAMEDWDDLTIARGPW